MPLDGTNYPYGFISSLTIQKVPSTQKNGPCMPLYYTMTHKVAKNQQNIVAEIRNRSC